MTDLIIAVTGAFIFVLSVLLAMFFLCRGQKELLRKLPAELNGRVFPFAVFPVASGNAGGAPWVVMLAPPCFMAGPAVVGVRYGRPASFRLSIALAAAFDRFGRRMGLSDEVRISDPYFNTGMVLYTDHPSAAVGFLGKPGVKDAVRAILDLGFPILQFTASGIVVRKPDYSTQDLDPARVRPLFDALSRLNAHL